MGPNLQARPPRTTLGVVEEEPNFAPKSNQKISWPTKVIDGLSMDQRGMDCIHFLSLIILTKASPTPLSD